MPVAISPVDGQVRAAPVEFGPQGGEQCEILLVDRALAAEMMVVLGDFQHPLARHVSAAEHVLQERHHVIGAVGTAERHEQHRIVVGGAIAAGRDGRRVHENSCATNARVRIGAGHRNAWRSLRSDGAEQAVAGFYNASE